MAGTRRRLARMCRVRSWLAAAMIVLLGSALSPVLRPLPSHAQQASDLQQLDLRGRALAEAGKYDEAIELYEALVPRVETRLGRGHPNLGLTLGMLGHVYNRRGRHGDAVPVLQRGLAIAEKAYGFHHETVAVQHLELANAFLGLDQFEATERHYRRALAIFEKSLSPDHPSTAKVLCNLAGLLEDVGRVEEAAALARRCVATLQKRLGPESPELIVALLTLSRSLVRMDRAPEAEPFLKQSLAIAEKAAKPGESLLARTLDALAEFYLSAGRPEAAEPLYRRSLALDETILGPGHPFIAGTLNNLANVYGRLGREVDAERAQQRALAIFEKALGPRHRKTAALLANVGLAQIRGQRWEAAYEALRRAAPIDRKARANLVIAAWGLAELRPERRADLAQETFEVAQGSEHGEASVALTQLAARFGAGKSAIAPAIREQQDLQAERRRMDEALIAALSQHTATRNDAAVADLRTRLDRIDARLLALSFEIDRVAPAFRDLAEPKPLAMTDAQALLKPDEALVVYLARSTDETFVWALTREGIRWHRIPIGYDRLSAMVTALRRGLDIDDLKRAAAEGKLFDLSLAHELHEALLAPVRDAIKGKRHLLVVPSGPLTGLPFHLLLTDTPAVSRPDGTTLGAYAKAHWLLRRHAVTVLPSVSSLKALRTLAKASPAAKPMIGFGDPIFGQQLVGSPSKGPDTLQRSATKAGAIGRYFKGSRADLDALRRGLKPLPETVDELRAVARSLSAPESELKLGAAASETAVKSTDLSAYRIVYFATHGLVAGELRGLAEPALTLTLPNEATDLDDGLLTASEVAQLKLNADWVVLSACNTAAGDKPGAEALSGLVRAFFYAGARTLLVTHWRVDSQAAVRLTTSTFANMQKEPAIGRSEALRRAMLAMIDDTSNPWNAYPDYWAAFSVIGEGGR